MVIMVIEQAAVKTEPRVALSVEEKYEPFTPPKGWLWVPLRWQKGDRRLRARLRSRSQALSPIAFKPSIPQSVWERTWEAVRDFGGLENLYLFAPDPKAFVYPKCDPLLLGRWGGRWFLVAQWGLAEDLKQQKEVANGIPKG